MNYMISKASFTSDILKSMLYFANKFQGHKTAGQSER